MRRRSLLAQSMPQGGGGDGDYGEAPIGVSIATEEGMFVPYAEWANQGTAVGVALRNTRRCLILALNNLSHKWSSATGDVSGVPTFTSTTKLGDYCDGQAYTQAMLEADKATNVAPYIATHKTITVGNKTLTGYVGSTGEWKMIEAVGADIEAAYTKLGLSFVTSVTNYWTSCERASGSVWIPKWGPGVDVDWSALSKTTARPLRVFYMFDNYEE